MGQRQGASRDQQGSSRDQWPRPVRFATVFRFTWNDWGVGPKKPPGRLPDGYVFRRGRGFHYQTGGAFGAGFWLIVAIPFATVGRSTSGVVSHVFYALGALFGLLALLNFAFYALGHNGGTEGKWIDDEGRP